MPRESAMATTCSCLGLAAGLPNPSVIVGALLLFADLHSLSLISSACHFTTIG